MTRTYEHVPNVADAAAARRLLGLDADAGPDDVEAAAGAARAAVVAPDEPPDLVRTAAHLHQRIEHARAVLLATMPPGAPSTAPPPPAPPPPPIMTRPTDPYATEPASWPPPAEHGRSARAARTSEARKKRSEHTRANVHAVVLVVALLLLGGTAFAVTRALSRSAPVEHAAASSTTVQSTAPATAPAPTFADRLVSGALGRPADGLAAGSAKEALAAWLAGYQRADADVVASGIDDNSLLMDLAEIGSRSVPADVDKVDCASFGAGTWRCKAGGVTPGVKRVEVVRTASGWRVRGWYGG